MLVGIDGNEANELRRVGSGQYAFEILRYLVQIKTETQFLIYLKNYPHQDLPKESKNWHYRVFGPKKLWTQIALPANLYLGSPKPDVFFTPGHFAPRFSPIPVIVTIFDLSFVRFPKMFRPHDLYQLRNWTAYSIRKATKILTISKSSKEDIVKYYKIPEEKVVVTNPGVGENFKPQSIEKIEAVKEKYQISGDYILYVGTLQPRKNLERLIEAFEKLLHTSNLILDTFQLVIAGKKGWLYDEIFAKVKESGLENKVIFTDFVPDEDLPPLFSGAKVYINVSLWEGFGIPVAEAMACEAPVVVSNTSSLPEVVGDAGILVNPENVEEIADGFRKVLQASSTEYETLKKKSIAQAKKFSWQKCARETLKVLVSLK